MRKTLLSGSTPLVAIAMILFGAANLARGVDEIDRAPGFLQVDFPMSIRARYDSTYTEDLYLSDTLARPYAFAVGPWLRVDPSLESRFALTKFISKRIEIGIIWHGRSPISKLDLFDFERQTVAAMIRVTP